MVRLDVTIAWMSRVSSATIHSKSRHGPGADRAGKYFTLNAQGLDLRIDQTLLILVEEEESPDRHREHQKIDGQNSSGQRCRGPAAA